MPSWMGALLIVGGMFSLITIRVPIGIAMFLTGSVGFGLLVGWLPLEAQLQGLVWSRFSNYDLSVIPLFILMGHFAAEAGFSRSLFKAADVFVGHLKGGVGMSAIVACASFGAICGSSVATAATMSQVALPEMRRLDYANSLATGTLVAGGTLGILIPPSIVLVIYAVLAEQNITKLFAAAFVPGVVAALFYIVAIAVIVRVKPGIARIGPKAGSQERWAAVRDVWPIALIFLVMLGGLYGGVFTPTEGATAGALGTLAMGIVRRKIGWRGFLNAFIPTAQSTAMIFLILLGADMMNSALAITQISTQLTGGLATLDVPPLLALCVLIGILILLGSVLDEVAILVLVLPIILPTILGFELFGLGREDKAIWFGILMLTVVQIGMITPPVGLNLFVVAGFAKGVKTSDIYRGVVPFVIADIVRIALLMFFPAISLVTVWLMK